MDALIALGSNIGDRLSYLRQACQRLQQAPLQLLRASPILENEAVAPATGRFLNATVLIRTDLSPIDLMRHLLGIENSLGRDRQLANRPIDLDFILAWDHENRPIDHRCPELELPHPRFLNRDFVLLPAALICGDRRFSQEGPKIEQAAAEIQRSKRDASSWFGQTLLEDKKNQRLPK